jgi:polyhydroxybutyrate depolymerase
VREPAVHRRAPALHAGPRVGTLRFVRYLLAALLVLLLLGVVAVVAIRHARSRLLSPTAQGPAGKGVKRDLTIEVDGHRRQYRLYVPPATARRRAKVPLVIVLHGGGGSGPEAEELTGMDPVADANGFLVAYPTGTRGFFGGSSWNGGDCCGPAMRRNVRDVLFASRLIDALVAGQRVDPRRVYVTGISNGAILAYRLACALPGKIAAIAPVAGALMERPCSPTRPVSVIAFHGTADRIVPWSGGANGGSGQRAPFPPVRATIETWLRLDRCRGTATVTYRRGDAVCRRYGTCADASDVVLCSIAGGGHTWPGGAILSPRHFGVTSPDISASKVMWSFFRRHPLPG